MIFKNFFKRKESADDIFVKWNIHLINENARLQHQIELLRYAFQDCAWEIYKHTGDCKMSHPDYWLKSEKMKARGFT